MRVPVTAAVTTPHERKNIMKSWFFATFLPSLFDRAGTNHSMWLTQRQTAVCVDNMEKHITRTLEFQGDSSAHLWFSCEWNGRSVRMNYSKLNKCGTIEFSFSPDELAVNREANKKERERLENESIERIKRNPERLKKNVDILEKEIEMYKDKLSWDDNEPADIAFYVKKMAEAKAKLAKLTT